MIIAEPSASYGKDAYYFSHDSNARNDQKCLKLRRVLGMEGYGIFWVLVEMLRDATDYKLPLDVIPDIAYETRVSEEKILAVINNFDLFEVDGGQFFSLRLIRSMELMQIKSEKYRKNALKRWDNATAMQLHSNGNALKESKAKQSKLEEPYFDGVEKAFEELTSDELLVEHLRLLIRVWWAAVSPADIQMIIHKFLLTIVPGGDLENKSKAEIKKYLMNWVSSKRKTIHEYAK